MRKNLRRRQFGLLIIDIALMYLSLVISLVIRNGSFPSIWGLQQHLRHFTYIFAGWCIIFYTIGMYRLERPFDDLAFAQRLIGGVIVAGLGSAVYFYLIPESAIEPKTVLVIFVAVYTLLFWSWRYAYAKARRGKRQRVGVGFIGDTPESRDMVLELSRRSALGYDARFVYDEKAKEGPQGLLFVQEPYSVRACVEDSEADLIVIASNVVLSPELSRELFGLLDRRVRFMRLPDFYELILRRVPIGVINDTWFLENIDLKAKLPYELAKRITDIFLASLFLLLSLPFWPLIALGIALGSKGPVFFTQKRLGRFNHRFTMIKFRTMRTERNDHSPTGEDDSRITRFGSFLRATRLDEIPQVLNILKGEMSFIGPRPERPEIAIELEQAIPYYRQRHFVKPGITGWDQVSGEYHSPSVEDTQKKLQYDLYYLKNMSFYLDVSIFFKTIMTVLQREGR